MKTELNYEMRNGRLMRVVKDYDDDGLCVFERAFDVTLDAKPLDTKFDSTGMYQSDPKPVEACLTGYFERMVTNPTGSQTYEEINHPDHYTLGIETSKYIRSWSMDFHTGNVVKYVTRAPYKGKYLSDLKKARWYLEQLIAEAEEPESVK